MSKRRVLLIALCTALLSFSSAAYAAIMPYSNTFIHVANDAGTRYDGDEETYGAFDETYWMGFTKGEGKGMNSTHMTTDLAYAYNGNVNVVNTATGSSAGTFWITDTGGQGYSDDIILMLSISGPVSGDFQANIRSGGWIYPSGLPEAAVYQTDVINETFTQKDFVYGPQTNRMCSYPVYPFYNGQDTGDPSTAMYYMFIDLYVGSLGTYDGAPAEGVSVTYSITGLDTQKVAFNAYAWRGSANAGSGINWTNDAGSSYLINSAPAPVPVPPALLLFGSGLAGMVFMGRRKA